MDRITFHLKSIKYRMKIRHTNEWIHKYLTVSLGCNGPVVFSILLSEVLTNIFSNVHNQLEIWLQASIPILSCPCRYYRGPKVFDVLADGANILEIRLANWTEPERHLANWCFRYCNDQMYFFFWNNGKCKSSNIFEHFNDIKLK